MVWSPDEAYKPFLAMGTLYTLAAWAAAAALWRRDGLRSI
jgi:hypothetical protein